LIYQLSLDRTFVAKYNTLREAETATGVPDTNIRASINQRRNSAGGFLWSEVDPREKRKSITPRRLFFDIETSPCIGFFWKPGYKLNIPYENIITEAAIICICYKWEGEKKVHHLTWDKNKSDKQMLIEFSKIINESDECVGQNSMKFDLPWIRTRCLFHRIPMFPDYIHVDTLKEFRSKFRFNSNRMNYVGQYLGLGGKIHTEFDLWRDITLKNDQKAMDKMVSYCKEDVRLLERIYHELKNHIKPKQNYGMLYNSDKISCPECGAYADELKVVHTSTTPAGSVKRLYKCKCGKHHTRTGRK
jgi:hypothetical protein